MCETVTPADNGVWRRHLGDDVLRVVLSYTQVVLEVLFAEAEDYTC